MFHMWGEIELRQTKTKSEIKTFWVIVSRIRQTAVEKSEAGSIYFACPSCATGQTQSYFSSESVQLPTHRTLGVHRVDL